MHLLRADSSECNAQLARDSSAATLPSHDLDEGQSQHHEPQQQSERAQNDQADVHCISGNHTGRHAPLPPSHDAHHIEQALLAEQEELELQRCLACGLYAASKPSTDSCCGSAPDASEEEGLMSLSNFGPSSFDWPVLQDGGAPRLRYLCTVKCPDCGVWQAAATCSALRRGSRRW